MIRLFGVLFMITCVISGVYGRLKPLPDGIRTGGDPHVAGNSQVRFLADRTYVRVGGARSSDQQIFDAILASIREADEYILLDMFLFNDLLGTGTTSFRGLSGELTDALIAKKTEDPDIVIQFITDPINGIYGGYRSPHIAKLREAGIVVIETDLSPLRDSNPIFSGIWRVAFQWIPTGVPAYLPNILDTRKDKLSLRPYLATLNFKANHRKVLVADYAVAGGRSLRTIISSANPHDGSSAHSNSGVVIDDDEFARAVIESERAVAVLSGASFIQPPTTLPTEVNADVLLSHYTEGLIKEKVVSMIDELKAGDSLDMAMFYLSDRDVVKALIGADGRGAKLRILLDPNKDAFGRSKDGVPNRQVADELLKNSKGNTEIRWCDTHGEQCHSKLLIFFSGGKDSMLLGSANLTRRNINDLNLEADVLISGSRVQAITDAREFFDETWSNESGKQYSVSYDVYANESTLKTVQYLIMEYTGLSSF